MKGLQWFLMLLFYVLAYLGVHFFRHRTLSWETVGAAAVSGVVFTAVTELLNRWRKPDKRAL